VSDPIERIAAGVTALTVNALVIAYVAYAMRPAWTEPGRAEQVVQVVFLPPAAEDKPRSKPSQARLPIASRENKPPAARLPLHPVIPNPGVLQVVMSPSPNSAPTLTADDWSVPPSLPVGEAKNAFAHNPLVRRPGPMQASVKRLRLTFHDRSMGGLLKAMSRNAACHELSSALSSNPASANAILESMKDWGCRTP
jgi:hypothetical protein